MSGSVWPGRKQALVFGYLWWVSLCIVVYWAPVAHGQDLKLPSYMEIPKYATALEGVPRTRVTSDGDSTSTTALYGDEAAENRVLVSIVNGQFFWASRENRPLELLQSGSFTYLSSGTSGYIKFSKVGDKILYMEHVNVWLSTITYWGELKVVTGR